MSTLSSMPRRSHIDMMADLIYLAQDGISKKALLWESHINHRLFNELLVLCKKTGLLNIGSDVFATEKGNKLLMEYRNLISFLGYEEKVWLQSRQRPRGIKSHDGDKVVELLLARRDQVSLLE